MDLGMKPSFTKHKTVIVTKRWPKLQFFHLLDEGYAIYP